MGTDKFDSPNGAGRPDLVAVFETADLSLLAVIKSILDGGEIQYIVQGETSLGMLPLKEPTICVSRPPFCSVVHVPGDQVDEARALLEIAQITAGDVGASE